MGDQVDLVVVVGQEGGEDLADVFAVVEGESELVVAGVAAVPEEAGDVEAYAAFCGAFLLLVPGEEEGDVCGDEGFCGADFSGVVSGEFVADVDFFAVVDDAGGESSVFFFVEGSDGLGAEDEGDVFGEEGLFEEGEFLEAFVSVDVCEAVALGEVKDVVAADVGAVKEDPFEDFAVEAYADAEVGVVLLGAEFLFDGAEVVDAAKAFLDGEGAEDHDVPGLVF